MSIRSDRSPGALLCKAQRQLTEHGSRDANAGLAHNVSPSRDLAGTPAAWFAHSCNDWDL
jgi:hypothetical protein